MYFKIFHRAWWSQKLPEVLAALEKSLRGALVMIPGPALRVRWRDRQYSAAVGWGGSQNPSWRSLTLLPARPRLSRKATEETFRGGQLLGLRRPRKYISGTWRRQRCSYRNPVSTRFPSSGLGLCRPNPHSSAAEAGSPAERNNLNPLRGYFP